MGRLGVPPHTAVLAPTHVSPSAAATGSAVPFFNHANLSAALLLAHSASSAGSGLAFLHPSAALPRCVFFFFFFWIKFYSP